MQHYCRVLWRTEGAWLEMHGPNTQIITGLRFSDTSWTTTNSINTWNNVLSLSENIKDIKGIMNVCALLPVISCLQIHPALSLSVWTIDPAALVKCHCYNYWNSTFPPPPFCYFIFVFAWASIKSIMKESYQPPSVLPGLYKDGIYQEKQSTSLLPIYPHLTPGNVINLLFDICRRANCKEQSGSPAQLLE